MGLIKHFFNLHVGEENQEKVLESVRSNITFRGATIWILACAIIIASVGLNVNATAVIIGAMLISPLMGPIIGAGFSLANYDFLLLKKSLFNLFIATILSVAVSAVYFYLSPFKEARSELLARTAPNIFDVVIAFFGGIAGAISITRIDKGLPIAGVAIATALMPPLCTAGYGLGTGNMQFFLGAGFLYLINCTFICIATYLVASYLQFPAKKQVDKQQDKKVKAIIYLLVMLLIITSTYFAANLYGEQKFKEQVNRFLKNEFENKGNVIIYKKINYTAMPKTIQVAFLTKKYTRQQVDSLNGLLHNYQLANAALIIRQDTNFVNTINRANAGAAGITEEELLVARLQNQQAATEADTAGLQQELSAFMPQVTALQVKRPIPANAATAGGAMPLCIYTSDKKITRQQAAILYKWLAARLKTDTLLLAPASVVNNMEAAQSLNDKK